MKRATTMEATSPKRSAAKALRSRAATKQVSRRQPAAPASIRKQYAIPLAAMYVLSLGGFAAVQVYIVAGEAALDVVLGDERPVGVGTCVPCGPLRRSLTAPAAQL